MTGPSTSPDTAPWEIEATQYTVSPVPLDDPEQRYAYPFNVTVEHRGEGLWAVCHMGATLNGAGDWEWEPRPSSREDDYLQRTRFDLDVARRMAAAVAPSVEVNGNTWATYLVWRAARRAAAGISEER